MIIPENKKLEFENIVITLINTGWSKSDAKQEAFSRIQDDEEEED